MFLQLDKSNNETFFLIGTNRIGSSIKWCKYEPEILYIR
jgi:hypothetical protein